MNNVFNAGLVYSEYRQRRFAFFIAATVAFFMSAYYVVGYMAGHMRIWEWDFEQGLNGYLSIGLCAAMTIYQFVVYSRGDVTGGKKATIIAVCVAVGFSLLSEVGQGMSRDHVRMETKSQQSPAYKTLVEQLGTGMATGSHPYSAELANAQMKLARCQQKVNAGVWSDCIESNARLNAVQNMIDRHYQQSASRAGALVATVKQWEKDESNYHPLVSLIQDVVGSSFKFASFLLSLALIIFFEYAFHYLGRAVVESKNELLRHGYDVTRKTRKIPKALREVQENKDPFPTDDTWNDELAKSGIDAPDDDALNKPDDGQAKRIVERATRAEKQPDTRDSLDTDTRVSASSIARDTPCTVHGDYPFTDELYKLLVIAVKGGDVAPTFRPVKQWLKSWEVGTSDRNRQSIASDALDKMADQGVLELNNQTGGIKKAKYVLSGKYRSNFLGSADEQLNMPLNREG